MEYFICKFCDEKFRSLKALRFHARWHNLQQFGNFKCDECSKEFSNKISFSNHKRWHNPEFAKKFLAYCRPILIKRNKSLEQRKAVSEAQSNENSSNWKGDEVGYDGIHSWVRRRKPKPALCENPFKRKNHLKKPKDLANISGKYLRDINDFMWICRSCHRKEHELLKDKFKGYRNI